MPTLVGQLSELAGDKHALANYIAEYIKKIEKSDAQLSGSNADSVYSQQIKKFNSKLREIHETVKHLDPHWSGENPEAKFNISSVLSEKNFLLRSDYAILTISMLNLHELRELRDLFVDESYKLQKLSRELSATLAKFN